MSGKCQFFSHFVSYFAFVWLLLVSVLHAEELNATRSEIRLASQPEKDVAIALPEKEQTAQFENPHSITSFPLQFSDSELHANALLTQHLLNQAINSGQPTLISHLLTIYQQFPDADALLVLFAQGELARHQQNYTQAIHYYRQILAINPELTPVRLQLAISLFNAQQNNAAEDQFEKSLADNQLPNDIRQWANLYLNALKNKQGWQFYAAVNYLREDNVNNASSDQYIENTSFTKNSAMLPQKAHGVGYYAELSREFNLNQNHYAVIKNDLYGKNYWDNHQYDDIVNRTYLGYRYKTANYHLGFLPFYEREWYGNHRYKRATGVRAELNYWFNPHWQLSSSLEYATQRYYGSEVLNGHNQLASLTLLWRRNPQQFFYWGADYLNEYTAQKSYSYHLSTFRFGLGQEFSYGISSRLGLSISQRHYQANWQLGRSFYFDRKRKDDIYQANLTLWKREWHLWGITPKLQFKWKKQRSNFASLYSYSDKSINLIFEKSF